MTTSIGVPAETGQGPSSSGWPRAIVLLVGSAAAVAVGVGMRGAAGIVAPIMLSLVLTIAVLPLVSWARRRGWPTWAGILLALVGVYAIVLVLVLGLAVSVVKLAETLPEYTDQASKLTSNAKQTLADHGLSSHTTNNALSQLDPEKVIRALTDLLSAFLDVLGNLFLLVTLLFFFCTAVPGFRGRAAALARSKPELSASLWRFIKATQRYLIVTAVFGAIVAVFDTAALWLIGVPLALTWGLFSFLTNFIPNIGFVIGVIPPALLALLDSGWQKMVAVLLIYSVINVVIQTFIQPRYVGATVGLSAEMTFLSLVIWTFLLGALGALLAVPMTLLVRAVLIDPDPRAWWVSPLIATEAESPPDPDGPAGVGQADEPDAAAGAGEPHAAAVVEEGS